MSSVDICFWSISFDPTKSDVLKRGHLGLSIDISCVWVAFFLAPKRKEIPKKVQWEDSFFLDSQVFREAKRKKVSSSWACKMTLMVSSALKGQLIRRKLS